jgi:hypothetical protein
MKALISKSQPPPSPLYPILTLLSRYIWPTWCAVCDRHRNSTLAVPPRTRLPIRSDLDSRHRAKWLGSGLKGIGTRCLGCAKYAREVTRVLANRRCPLRISGRMEVVAGLMVDSQSAQRTSQTQDSASSICLVPLSNPALLSGWSRKQAEAQWHSDRCF